MGRIEEALKKAKASRGGSYGAGAAVTPRFQPNSATAAGQGRVKSDVSRILAGHIVPADNEKLREQRVIAASEHDERVGPYRQLRTQLLKTMRDNQWTTLALTSAHERAGKSLTAANLAISLSRDVNTQVLLVDLDLNTPTVHQKLNLKPDKGLVDYLKGECSLEEIVFDPGVEQLIVLVGRSAGKESSELLGSPKMQELMQDLCRQDVANITIFDLPPLLRNDDAIMFAPFADATLLVVEAGVTTEDQLQESMRLLRKANVIGTILNKSIE
jgi:capsular exopolysaccharide synthesis family protein